MDLFVPLLMLLAGIAAGAIATWLFSRSELTILRTKLDLAAARTAEVETEAKAAREAEAAVSEENAALRSSESALAARLESERTAGAEKLAMLEQRLEEGGTRIADFEARAREDREAAAKAAEEIASLRASESGLKAELEAEQKAVAEKVAILEDAKARLQDAFKALSAEALKTNSDSFLSLAKETLLAPVTSSIEKMDQQLREIEKSREGAYAGLNDQVRSLGQTTMNLVQALRAPKVRGRWGEIQLERLIELAGMKEHCRAQPTFPTEGGAQRPDYIIELPNDRRLVVDAKVPLQAYLDAVEASDENVRTKKLTDHARQVREQAQKLGDKSYWKLIDPAPEFVIMFLPGEVFFSAAVEYDPNLIERAAAERVIITTPTTFVALLMAVAHGWRQAAIARNAQQVSAVGRELYERLTTFGHHFESMRKGLEGAVRAYNSAAGSLESRVLVSARRLKELEAATGAELESPEQVDTIPRQLSAEAGE